MDYYIFIIMCIISTSGWVITNYAITLERKITEIIKMKENINIDSQTLFKLTQYWTVGRLFKQRWFLVSGALLQWLPIVASLVINIWWSAILVLIISIIFTNLLINMLGSKVQAVPFVGIILSSLLLIFR